MQVHKLWAAGTMAVLAAALPATAIADSPDDALPPGQVYECSNHGQRVFSDKRCGPNASIRQLNALNTMTPPAWTPAAPAPVRAPPSYSYPPDSGYDSAEGEAEDSSAAPPSVVYYGVARRRANLMHPRPPRHRVHPHSVPAAHAAIGR